MKLDIGRGQLSNYATGTLDVHASKTRLPPAWEDHYNCRHAWKPDICAFYYSNLPSGLALYL